MQGVAAAGLAIVQELASEKHVHEISCFQLINESTIITSPGYAIGVSHFRSLGRIRLSLIVEVSFLNFNKS